MSLRYLAALCLTLFAGAAAAAPDLMETYAGRDLYVHVPRQLPAAGHRAMVIVLHGGLGNAHRILSGQAERGMNLDTEADCDGFVVAYLNGTPVAPLLGDDKLGWNAGGGCCGLAARRDVDDVSYIRGAVARLVDEHGIDAHRVYGIGHSNGGMMVMRVMCESGTLASVISIAGPLNLDDAHCVAARGKPILSLHGQNDQNVPIAGGVGPLGLSRVEFKSEDSTRRTFIAAGAHFELQVLPDTDHFLDHIEEAIQRTEGVTLAGKAARYFNLSSNALAIPEHPGRHL